MNEINESGVYRLTKYEQEVHLSFNEEDKTWEAYVSSQGYIKKFDEAGWECVKTQYYSNGEVMAKFYKAPKNAVSIRKIKEKRELTEEERNVLKERVKLMHEAKNKKKNDKNLKNI